jgi:hypothetical protein
MAKVGARERSTMLQAEGRGFEIRWDKLIFSIYLILQAALCPWVYSGSNRSEYQKQKNNVSEVQSAAGA